MRSLLVFGWVLVVGCAGSAGSRSVSHRVSPTLVAAFPEEGRRWTYEAENEVIIALDLLDGSRDRLAAAGDDIAAAESAAAVAAKRGAGREVTEARIALGVVNRDRAEAEVRAAEIRVYCARGSLELTKARLAVRFDLPVEAGYVTKFEEQYQSCAAELEAAQEEVERRSNQTITARERWRELRAEYVRRTGDHNHGLWID